MKRSTRKTARIPLLRTRTRITERPRVLVVQRGSSACELSYTLRRSTRRTIGFQIDGRGLTISAPLWVSLREIESSIVEKTSWIVRKQVEWRAYERARAKAAPRYCDGGHVRFLGRRLTLRITPYVDRHRRTHFLLAGDELWVAGPSVDDAAWLERKVTAWMKSQARDLFEVRMQPFVRRLGRGPKTWALSAARSRWGSCSPDGKILLSWRLIHFSLPIIDYVIAHEIGHLKEMNHGPRFWAIVDRLLPGYERARDELRRYPDGLMPA
ncbi:MAG: M48 family metallopeptidase [Lautropia sp.]